MRRRAPRVPDTVCVVAVKLAGAPGIEDGVQTSNVRDDEEELAKLYGTIPPKYSPKGLFATFEQSSLLQPNITAYATNIEMFGHQLEATIDLAQPDADEKIHDAIMLERIFDGEAPIVLPEEVAARRSEIERVMRLERIQLEAFFEHACPTMSWLELREKKRIEEEVTGNAYWEIVRDRSGFIAEINYVPSVTVRATSQGSWVKAQIMKRISACELRRVEARRRFRRYVQIIQGVEAVWFKELDDPRVMSSATGRFYGSLEDLKRAEGETPPATEILHFKLLGLSGPYGVPRWIGASPSISGQRASEEVNAEYFDDNAIPPSVVLVSGGTLGSDADERIRKHLQSRKERGRKAAHDILVLEAVPPDTPLGTNPAAARVEWHNMRGQQQTDAVFGDYEKACTEKVGGQFRLPRLLRGDATDFNRATAESSLEYAEQQVFQPERQKFDHVINARLLATMGVRFWKFRSTPLVVRNANVVSEVLERLVRSDIILPAEARPIAGDALGKTLEAIDEPWTKLPHSERTRTKGAGDALSELVSMRAGVERVKEADIASHLRSARLAEADGDPDARTSELESETADGLPIAGAPPSGA